ncbi:universal stress protein [Actinomadura darangshiensis]|uniref:Universal stress protein n=1 Tax=Actinomadura darangshiensis TaxID=705336 RepID=A0A4R5BED3_9ACTN|nr:universal stress protein [Actinomadura darangshiensis]TDD84641.1 universal stress protein [Actinomadura darangshiensis]
MTVLIAYDGSDDAQAAVEYVAAHLRAEPTVIMTVWEPLLLQMSWAPLAAAAPVAAEPQPGDQWEEEKQAERLAQQGADLAGKGGLTDVSTRAERGGGPVWAAIVDVADELDASLIVTGSRGLAGARSVILGSVSTRVLHHAKRPVLVVPPKQEEKDG